MTDWIINDPQRHVSPEHRDVEHLDPAELQFGLMRRWRQRLEPSQIPGLPLEKRRRRRVSIETMAILVGVSPVWYHKLEHGARDANFSDSLINRVAYSLRLHEDERRVLFRLATGHEPPVLPVADATAVDLSVLRILQAQPWPAWVSDPSWEALALNDAAFRWFPHMRWERNIMRWVYAYPESQLQLINWKTVWAPNMLAQMRAALALNPDYEPLAQLVAESLELNADARDMWEHDPRVVVHPDGDQRWLYLPGSAEPTQVKIVAWEPMQNRDQRTIVLVPVDGYIPPECNFDAEGRLAAPRPVPGPRTPHVAPDGEGRSRLRPQS